MYYINFFMKICERIISYGLLFLFDEFSCTFLYVFFSNSIICLHLIYSLFSVPVYCALLLLGAVDELVV